MEIIPAITDEHIQTVAQLAAEIWTQHFIPIIGADQVAYMLKTVQSADAITHAIRQDGYQYFMLAEDKKPFGYFAIAMKDGSVFLNKLYIRLSCRGKGYARAAFAFIQKYARDHGASTIWLTVNIHNTDVIGIYEKMGFHIEGPIVQDIGGGFVMDDYKMVYPVTE